MNINFFKNRSSDFEPGLNGVKADKTIGAYQNEMSFRQAIENSIPSGISVVDDTGKQVYVNQSFCKMFGWDESELLEKLPPFVYWAKQDTENISNVFKQTLNNNAPKEGFDLVFCHKSGRLIPVNVIISSFKQENNNTFFLANVIDITERRRIEEELKQSQLLLRSSIESQKDTIILSIDKNYKYLVFNKAHFDAMKFAYNQEVKIGMNFLDYVTKNEDRKLLKVNIDNALSGRSHSQIQTFGDANIASYEVFYNPIVNEKNEIIGCALLARNINERIQAEQELKDSEIKFREIINQIYDAIIVFDERKKIIIWNKGAEQIYGLKAENVLNKNIADIQYQFTPPALKNRASIESVIKDIVTQRTPEFFNNIIESEIISLNSENIRNIQTIVFPIRFDEHYLFCTVIRDTTEIKRYEREILNMSEEKDKFYSLIAQYLYTPFNVFNNFSKLLVEELDNLPIKEIQKMAVMMSKSASNLYSLLDNLLQWTKLHQGKIPFEPEKLNFSKISQEAVSVLSPYADAKNITINHFIDGEVTVFADLFMLKTILRNLVSSLIKFSGSDGQIDIFAEQTESNAIISVQNNRTELDPEYLKKLFDTSQITSTLGATEEKGSTLGLLLCKEFVGKHGGEIWAESENDKGSEFKFTLPIFNGQAHSTKNKL
jgi:PAS domain S-box-containing protein